ncbi:hypothetical protein EZS27_010018 [termite gut metagenome]|uniref:Uncharacterized protein n=1 Tax=termite gut metagenome TaxID=433724 RepID=A0A5J4SA87_9ZZZZ
MTTDKIDSSAVYALFEELKQKIVEFGNNAAQSVQPDSSINTGELSALVEELRNLVGQKQFSPEQVKALQDNIGGFTRVMIDKTGKKIETEVCEVTKLINQIIETVNTLNIPQKYVIRREFSFAIDFRNSKAAITMIAMGVIILLSLAGNIWQYSCNAQLKDNDLKYRYVKMQGAANHESLLNLETVFTYNRNKDSITIIRKRVETYERLVKEQAEKIERARLNAKEAERLEREVESVKNRK